MKVGRYKVSDSLQIAILKSAMKLPGHEESLKAAYAETFRTLAAQWKGSFAKDSFADELFEATMPRWQTEFETFQIESHYEDPLVETCGYALCMEPPNVKKNEERNKGRNKEWNKGKNQKRAKNPASLKEEDEKLWGDVLGDILKNFMEEARPTLEETYGKGQSS